MLRVISHRCDRTVAQVVLNWTMHRPGITSVLSGAKRPGQIIENAGGDGWRLEAEDETQIESAYRDWLMRAATYDPER